MSKTCRSRSSIHADYRCRHSGDCCTVDWDVPVELPVYRSLQRGRSTAGRLQRRADAGAASIRSSSSPDLPEDAAAMLRARPTRAPACSSSATRGCASSIAISASRRCRRPAATFRAWRCTTRAARSSRSRTSVRRPRRCCFATTCRSRSSTSPPAFPPADYDGLTVDARRSAAAAAPTRADGPRRLHGVGTAHGGRCADVQRVPESVAGDAGARRAIDCGAGGRAARTLRRGGVRGCRAISCDGAPHDVAGDQPAPCTTRSMRACPGRSRARARRRRAREAFAASTSVP